MAILFIALKILIAKRLKVLPKEQLGSLSLLTALLCSQCSEKLSRLH